MGDFFHIARTLPLGGGGRWAKIALFILLFLTSGNPCQIAMQHNVRFQGRYAPIFFYQIQNCRFAIIIYLEV